MKTETIYRIPTSPNVKLRKRFLDWLCELRPNFCRPYMGLTYQVYRGRWVLVHAFYPFPAWFLSSLAAFAHVDPHREPLKSETSRMQTYLTKIATLGK